MRWRTEPSADGACRIKVSTLALSATGDDSFSNTLTEAHNAGFTSLSRRFVIWVDGTNSTGICGIGEQWNDDQPGQSNMNNGGMGAGYYGLASRIDQKCWGTAGHSTEAHELGHNLGAVQASAPHDSGGGHCTDEWDIMCYSDSPNFPAMTYVCGTQGGDRSHDNRLDCNHDDYFHTNPPAGTYLATHWNIARNTFLREAGLTHDQSLVTTTSDGDTVIEPGESFSFRERVRNRAASSATGVSASVSSSSPRVAMTAPSRAYPDIAAGATAANATPFTATLAANAPCGQPVPMTASLTSSKGTQQVAVTLPTGNPGPVRSLTAAPGVAIPDGSPTGVSSNIAMTGVSVLKDLNVRVNITHTWDEDLTISLRSPSGVTIPLVRARGGSGDNFTNTVLDDEAATAIASGAAPFTGSFRPEMPLSTFDGVSANGTWTLTVVDSTAQDAGRLDSWTLDARGSVCPPAPNAYVFGGKLTYVAAAAKANTVTISRPTTTSFRIRDTGAPVIPGVGCTTVDPNTVTCPTTGVTAIAADVKDGDDTLTVTAPIASALIGGPGTDRVTGGPGNDLLDGGTGPDVITGLGGTDTMTYKGRTERVVADIDGVADDGGASDGRTATSGDNVKADVENLTGGSGGDTLIGSTLRNRIDGGPGADTMRGLGSSDILFTRDGVADTEINCEGGGTAGTADQAQIDTADPAPRAGCETVTRS